MNPLVPEQLLLTHPTPPLPVSESPALVCLAPLSPTRSCQYPSACFASLYNSYLEPRLIQRHLDIQALKKYCIGVEEKSLALAVLFRWGRYIERKTMVRSRSTLSVVSNSKKPLSLS
jgi:hypothetical protein